MRDLIDVLPPDTLRWLQNKLPLRQPSRESSHVYNMREFNSRVSAVANLALQGVPQFVQKRKSHEVLVVMTIEDFEKATGRNTLKPGESFYDLSPVATGESPLEAPIELEIPERPGKEKIDLKLD